MRVRAMRLAATLAVGSVLAAPAAAQDWAIDDFQVAIAMQPDGGLRIAETITVTFTGPRRGIYRTIPVHYAVALHQYSLRFRLLGVRDDAGAARPVRQTRDGASVHLRIGDPDVTVTGRHVYRIEYTVQRAVLHELDRAVLRWNATGTEWEVPIGSATVTVTLPADLPDSAITWDAFTGVFGAADKNFTRRRVDDRTLEFRAPALGAREGITVEIGIPADAVAQPTRWQRARWFLGDNLGYQVFLAVLAGCLLTWYRRGRDAAGHGSIPVQYEAPGDLGPAEVGTLADETAHMQDLTAAIVDMAVRGYLVIEELPKAGLLGRQDYTFIRKKAAGGLKDYEATLFNGIFSGRTAVKLSDLEREFHTTVAEARTQLYKGLAARGYFDGAPDGVRQRFAGRWILVTGLLLVAAGILQRVLVGRVFPGPMVIGGALAVVTVILASRAMPRRTRKGRLAWERVRGLEEYLQRAEQRELQEQERRGVFETLLPHAIALGLANRWASAFEGIYRAPPDWWRGRTDGEFSTRSFTERVNQSVSRMNSALPATPRSESGGSGGFSGGGSSGGGFGGGGGGAW